MFRNGICFITLIPSDENRAVCGRWIKPLQAFNHCLKIPAGCIGSRNNPLHLLKVFFGDRSDQSNILCKRSIKSIEHGRRHLEFNCNSGIPESHSHCRIRCLELAFEIGFSDLRSRFLKTIFPLFRDPFESGLHFLRWGRARVLSKQRRRLFILSFDPKLNAIPHFINQGEHLLLIAKSQALVRANWPKKFRFYGCHVETSAVSEP